MTDRETMRELVVRAYAARDSGDVEELISVFDPDAVCELVGAKSALEVAGAVRSHASIRARMSEFIAAFRFSNRQIKSFVIDGKRAAVHSVIEVTFIPTKRAFTSEVLDLFRFADGKIVELLEFADTALIKDVVTSVPR